MRLYKSGSKWAFWCWTPLSITNYIERLHIIKTPWFAIDMHWIKNADPEPFMHDHPVTFFSIILRGAYLEERPDSLRWRTPFNFIRATDQHRIRYAHPRTVTLCFMGPKVREWGFHLPRGWVPWREYYQLKRVMLSTPTGRLMWEGMKNAV